MSFRSLIRDIQELTSGIGSSSWRRSVDGTKLPSSQSHQHHRSRSHGAIVSQSRLLKDDIAFQGPWANLPPELLRDVIRRIEASEASWPNRKHVVACAAVCTSWRRITKELVGALDSTGKLTFPLSLKQAGPKDNPLQCYIKRDRASSTYRLYLGLSPTQLDSGKFLMAARRIRRPTSTDYIISLDSEEQSRGSSSYVGKLRSNFLGTKFTIYDSQPPHNGAVASTKRAGRRIGSKQVSPRIPAGSFDIAHIAYELNVLGTRGPRRMHCTVHSVPASSVSSQTNSRSLPAVEDDNSNFVPVAKAGGSNNNTSNTNTGNSVRDLEPPSSSVPSNKDAPLVLKNKAPRWHDQLQCWCLNFRGRVTVASVKNFQLVAAQPASPDQDKVLLQFGKIGKDMFTMDFRYPLSAFQAFAICLSSFDTKLACE